MKKAIETRIIRLETRHRMGRCQVCRTWGESTHEVRTMAGEVRIAARPEECPQCGRVVPIQMRRDYLIIEDADDYAA